MESAAVTSSIAQEEFIQLLVAPLQNQDPLEPVKQENFVAQLAQFSTLQGVETLNANFSELLELQKLESASSGDLNRLRELSEGAGLLGKTVTYMSSGDPPEVGKGQVTGVNVFDSKLYLAIEGRSVSIDQVVAIAAGDVPTTAGEPTNVLQTLAAAEPTLAAELITGAGLAVEEQPSSAP